MTRIRERLARLAETTSQLAPWSLVLALALTIVAGCSPDGKSELTRSRYLMGTPLTITVPDDEGNEAAVEAAFDEVARVEALISTWREDSALARINAAAIGEPTEVEPELFDLLEKTVEWSRRTGGAFDPTAGRILFAWDLRGDGRIPSASELQELADNVGVENLTLDRSGFRIVRERDLLVEEGGFGKGYALDRALEILVAAGVDDAMIDFGGQVTIHGRERTVGIASPADRLRPGVEIDVSSGSVATSSGSERFFEADGTRYSHLFDPRTARALPPRGSVTVLHESGLVADILATALYVMGPEAGLTWSDQHDIKAIFITPGSEGTWRVSPSREAIRSVPIRGIDRAFEIERKHES